MVHYNCKVVMLGEGSVGKTSLIRRFVQKTFTHDYITTVGSNFLLKKIELAKETKMTMQLWDLSGQDSFITIRPQYYLHSHGGILVFDLTRKPTMNELNKWYNEFVKKAGTVPLMVFGNKCDLREQKEVSREEGEIVARRFNAPYVETSALDGTAVESSFIDLAWRIIQQLNERRKAIKAT
ncbi:MAG: GTP-binding protein [Candidatus Hodarchaeota archaeon]